MLTFLLASVILGQVPEGFSKKLIFRNPVTREDRIWNAVDVRLSRQVDVWFDAGDYPKIVKALIFESELNPHDYETWTNLGWMQENVEDGPKAEAVYRRYLAQNPTDPDRALPLGTYFNNKRMYDKVIEAVAPVISDKAHANNFRILARAYDRTGKYQDSIRTWQRYLKLAPGDGSAKVNLERVLKKVNGSR